MRKRSCKEQSQRKVFLQVTIMANEPTPEERLFCKLAIKYGVLTRVQIKECLKHKKLENSAKPLAVFLIEKGYLDDQKLETILSIHERNIQAFLERGYQYKTNHDFEKAVQDFTTVLKNNPFHVEALLHRGNAYIGLHQYDKAMSDFSKVLEIEPNHVVAYTNRGLAYNNLGQVDYAIQDFTRALELDPQDAKPFYCRGVAYHFKKQYQLALHDYSKAIELDDNLADAYNNRGVIYTLFKQYDAAVSDWETALCLDPQFTSVRLNLQALLRRREVLAKQVAAKNEGEGSAAGQNKEKDD